MAIPVSLAEAKAQLKVDDNDRDQEIEDFIADAAAWVESYTGHILVARDVTETFVGFGRINMRAWPIKPGAVPIVTYSDAAGQAISVTAVRVVASSRPARIAPWVATRWPSVSAETPVTVTVRAGYEDDDEVPRNLRRAILVLISAFDADREGGDLFQLAEATARNICSRLKARTL